MYGLQQLAYLILCNLPTNDKMPTPTEKEKEKEKKSPGSKDDSGKTDSGKDEASSSKDEPKKITGLVTFPMCWGCRHQLKNIPPCNCPTCGFPN